MRATAATTLSWGRYQIVALHNSAAVTRYGDYVLAAAQGAYYGS